MPLLPPEKAGFPRGAPRGAAKGGLGPRWCLAPLLLGAVLAACGGGESDTGGEGGLPAGGPPPRAEGPSVVLVTLDTTRADRLGCYGHAAARTPNLDALATGGARFTQARSHVPLTLPSHATLLTGVHPPGTGLHVNFQGVLPEELPTVAQLLRARGWRTGAFVSAWVLDAAFGLARGFEVYDDVEADPRHPDAKAERTADRTIDAALAWLREAGDAPVFLWVHLFDPHDPYEPPPPFDALESPYDGEIAFVDQEFGRLLEALAPRRAAGELVLCVAGDHGEALGEHDEDTHGLFLYDATMRVPLLFEAPGRIPPGTVVSAPVGLVDVAPTLLVLAGVDVPASVEGRSLLARCTGDASPARPVYLENEYPRRSFGWAALRGLVAEDRKLIRGPGLELYDLDEDPGELRDLATAEAQSAERLATALESLRRSLALREAGAVDGGVEETRRLAALGYVAGETGELEGDDSALADPRERTAVFRGAMRAKRLSDEGRHAEVLATLEPLLAISPESDQLWGLAGSAYLALGRYAEAAEALERSLRTREDDAARLVELGDALRALSRVDEARARYEQAIESDPNLGQAHSRLGLLFAQAGEFERALAEFRRFVELEPDSANAHTNLANALLAVRRFEEGIAELRTALAKDPQCGPAFDSLWRALDVVGRWAEATTTLREACRVTRDGRLVRELARRLAVRADARPTTPREPLELALATMPNGPRTAREHDLVAICAAAAGDFERAIAEERAALAAAREAGDRLLETQAAQRLELFQRRQPYREPPPGR